jgi:hypothetical protein
MQTKTSKTTTKMTTITNHAFGKFFAPGDDDAVEVVDAVYVNADDDDKDDDDD